MYKKITHTIVEEHFEHPEAVALSEQDKSTWKAPLRYYADGVQIASGLPASYQLATGNNSCGNCIAFNADSGVCMYWQQPVRTEYVCPAWAGQTTL